MPDFKTLLRWERYEPQLGNNRSLEPAARFYVEMAVGLTKLDLTALGGLYGEALKSQEKCAELMAAAYEPFIRLGQEPLTFDGKPVATLAEYFKLCETPTNACNLVELPRALLEANSVDGMSELFFERLSGGFTSMQGRSNDRAGNQRAAH